jgi:hypothetical protein
VNEACCGRAWDEFAAGRTCPSWDAPEADRAAWDAELEKWVRARVRPWAFGTISVPWEGVDDQSIREAADDKRLDAWDLVEDSLSGHHEGAIDLVGNVAALQKAADAWRAAPRPPDAGDEPTRGPEADAALAAAVAEWNAAQRANVVSYEADMATAVPVFPDATRDEAIAWSRGQVAEAERRLGAARGFCTEEDAPVRAR